MQPLRERVQQAANLIVEVNDMARETAERMRAAHVPEELIASQCQRMYGVDVLPSTDTAMQIVREIVEKKGEYGPYMLDADSETGHVKCRYCDAPVEWAGFLVQGNYHIEHTTDCLYVRAREIVARMGDG